jgi:ATP-dependent protease HslVU (ClpYQ) peptidase subunit
MTIIIGIKHEGDVWLGADSFLGTDSYLYHVKEPKIFRAHVSKGGPMLIGASGGSRAGFLVRSMLPPEHLEGVDTHTYIAEFFVNALRDRYEKAGYLKTDNGTEENEAILMVGYQGSLFVVWYNFQVDEYDEDYAAIGSGMDIALGALHVLAEFSHGGIMEKLRAALFACEYHNPYVRRPFTIMKVEEPKEHAADPTVTPD